MITTFTGGDTSLLSKLVELGQFHGLDSKWREHQLLANQFIEPALDAYFLQLGIDPFMGGTQNG